MAFELPDLPYAHDRARRKGHVEGDDGVSPRHPPQGLCRQRQQARWPGTEWEGKSLEDIITGNYKAGEVGAERHLQQRLAALDHMQFWEMMGPGDAGVPAGAGGSR